MTLRKKQDDAIKDFIEREVLISDDGHDNYAKKVTAWERRFEAARSVQGMTYGEDQDKFPKLEPWKWASDVGVPIEAITVRAIIARFVKTIFTKPICNITGRGFSDKDDAKVVQEYNEYTLEDEMQFERQYYDILMDTCLAGDGIGKLIEADEEYDWDETYFTLINPESGEPFPDPSTKNEFDEEWSNGYPIEVNEDFQPQPDLATGIVPEVKEITVTKTDQIYFGTKLIPVSPKDLILPEGADNYDYNELAFLGHKLRKNWHWLKKREGPVKDGGYDKEAIDRIKPNSEGTKGKQVSTVPKIDLIEVWGKVDLPLNEDGSRTKLREIIALYARESGELLGWINNPYKGKRQFYHWQIMPKSHSARGMGIPEFSRGIRDLIDSLLNNMVNRDTINSHPPFIYDEESGFDPEIHAFGPQEFWGVNDQARLGRLDMGNTTEFTSQWIIEFVMGLLQRLFGVTDYNLGSESNISSNKTARGIMAIIGEGNFSFDTMIKLLNMTNKKFFEGNILMHAKMLREFGREDKVFHVTEDENNPYRKIGRKTLDFKWNFIPRGTSVDNNQFRRREDAKEEYAILRDNIFFSPELTPETANNFKEVTQNLVDAYELKGVNLPDYEELQQQLAKQQAKVQEIIQKKEQYDKLKATAKHKKGTPEGEAAKKVLADIEMSGKNPDEAFKGVKDQAKKRRGK